MPVPPSEKRQQLGLWEAQERRDQTFGRALRFKETYFEAHPAARSSDRLNRILTQLAKGSVWDVLVGIDGPFDGEPDLVLTDNTLPSHVPSGTDNNPLRQEARTFSLRAFSRIDLHEILDIYKAFADMPPEGSSMPGLRNYSRLFLHLNQNPDSLFNEIIGQRQRAEILNLAFYESLGMTSGTGQAYRILPFLSQYFEQLDPQFAKKGLPIFQRNVQENMGEITLEGLDNALIQKYWDFVKRINGERKKLKISDSQIESLVRPYISAATLSGIEFGLRFGDKEEPEEHEAEDEDLREEELEANQPTLHVKDMLSDPLVVRLLKGSGNLRKHLAKQILSPYYQYVRDSFETLVEYVPQEVLDDVLAEVAGIARHSLSQNPEESLKLRRLEGEIGDKLRTLMGPKTKEELDWEKSRGRRRR